ncbi:hypothetical protein Tco_1157791 [Tanacetum coccineum]
MGGLGVGSLQAKNLGLLAKWKLRFLTKKDALWRKEWRAPPRGRSLAEFSSLLSIFGDVNIDVNRDDIWSWDNDASGSFKVKTLTCRLQDILLSDHSIRPHHMWNSWVPQKCGVGGNLIPPFSSLHSPLVTSVWEVLLTLDVPSSTSMSTPKDGFDIVHGKTGNGGMKPESVEGADVAIPLAAVDEVSFQKALVDSLVMAIPFQNGLGHSMETIGKQNDKPQHIDGVRLIKPQPNYFYRVVSKPINVNGEASTSQPKGNKEASSQPKSNVNGQTFTSQPKENKEATLVCA